MSERFPVIAPQGSTKGGSGDFNHHGQRIGSKGERTRKLLIDCTIELLRDRGLREVSVVDVARAANTSPATFYVYFRSVADVVLAALDVAIQAAPELEALANADWSNSNVTDLAASFTDAYTDFWNEHRTIYLVRNLAAEEGDLRFQQMRYRASVAILEALAAAVVRAQQSGCLDAGLSPRACAASMVMLLERLAAVGPVTPESEGLSYPELKAAAAAMIAAMLGVGAKSCGSASRSEA